MIYKPNTPHVLLPYQQTWLSDDSQVKVWAKSRRIGASWCEACDAVLTASAEDGANVLYTSYNRPMSQTWISDAADWARHFGMAPEIREELWPGSGHGENSIRNFYIQFKSGFRIQALSSRPNNLRGVQGNIVLDEAAFVENLDEMLKSAIALLIWGGKLRVLSTFNGENAFYDLVENIRKGHVPYTLHVTTLDDALEAGLYERICLVSEIPWSIEAQHVWRETLMEQYGEAGLEELLCVPSSASGMYISTASIEQCMIEGPPVLRLTLNESFMDKPQVERQIIVDQWIADEVSPHLDVMPTALRHFAGLDFGRSGDISSLVLLTEHEDLTYQTPFIIELRQVPFESQRQIVVAVLARTPHLIHAAFDRGGSGAYLEESVRLHFGDKIEGISFTERWYQTHFPKLKDWLENKRLRLPRHTDVLRDLKAVELIRGIPRIDPNKRHTGSDGFQRHGDTAIALVLAVYAASGSSEPAAGQMQHSAGHSTSRPDRGRHPWHTGRR